MPKIYLLLSFLLLSYYSYAQKNLPTKYYDSSFLPVPAAQAFFYTETIKKEDIYYYSTYRAASKKIYKTESYYDTSRAKPAGIFMKYFETGRVEDSIYYNNNGSTREGYHFYPGGKLEAHFGEDSKGKTYSLGYNEDGTIIPGYIAEKEASFKGGQAGWMNFISHEMDPNVPVNLNARPGQYTVIIRFVIDKQGNVFGVYPETNLGFGMEAEVMRVIKKSPAWKPAIQYGKNILAYRRQPITFAVIQ